MNRAIALELLVWVIPFAVLILIGTSGDLWPLTRN